MCGHLEEILKNYIKDSFAEMGFRLSKLEDLSGPWSQRATATIGGIPIGEIQLTVLARPRNSDWSSSQIRSQALLQAANELL